jgi:hypothetical protein
MTRLSHLAAWMLLAALAATPAAAGSLTNLVQNGNFALSGNPTDYNYEFSSTYGDATAVTDWTGNNGFNLYFWAGTQDSSAGCAHTRFGDCANYFWPTMTALTPTSNFVAMDGDQTAGSNLQGGISQSISGLIAGQTYLLTFDWGGAQLENRSGATTEQLQVSLGSQTLKTGVLNNASGGFTGWFVQNFTFTASAATETLAFLSIGTPAGQPPVVVLDDISLTIPEPSSLAAIAVGAAMVGLLRRRGPPRMAA